MIFKLYRSNQEQLLSMPETGMGYQLIEGRSYGDYRSKQYIVLNSELIVENDNLAKQSLRKIFTEGFSRISSTSNLTELKDVKLVNKEQFNLVAESSIKTSGGAKDGPVVNPDGKSYFVRLSAYDNDRRIDKINKRLLPGSYTTTQNDYVACIKTNDDPIERYALPSEEKIEWAFYIQPLPDDSYRFGIVQPDFGRRGGGEECLFENGTSFGTFKLQKHYGEKI